MSLKDVAVSFYPSDATTVPSLMALSLPKNSSMFSESLKALSNSSSVVPDIDKLYIYAIISVFKNCILPAASFLKNVSKKSSEDMLKRRGNARAKTESIPS